MNHAARLKIVPQPSRQLAGYLLLIHLAALLVLWLLPIAEMNRWLAGFFLLLLGWGQYCWQVRCCAGVAELIYKEGGPWRLRNRAGKLFSVRLLADSFVHPQLMVLRLAGSRRQRWVVLLLPDSEDRETLRRLRVCLRR